MYKNNLDVVEFGKWNKKILNIYWLIIMIIFAIEVIAFFITTYIEGYIDSQYFKLYVILPVFLNFTILTVTNVIYVLIKDKYERWIKYLIILCSTLLACSIVYVHYGVSVIYVLFIFPIFLSELYRDKKLTLFSMIINLICYLLTVFLYLPLKLKGSYHHNYFDFLAVITLIISTFIIVLSFIDRAEEIIQSLLMVHENQQELTIKNFIMEFNSKIEPSTGLYNHKTFYEYLECLIEQSECYGFSLSLAVLDIDNFKRINDTYGHSLGDKVIAALADIIKGNIDADDYAARYGGEEFAIIFTDKNKEKALEITEKIRIKFYNTIINEIENEKFSISIGLSEYSSRMSRQTFFENADAALYNAKKSGKNKTIFYNG